ncbi:MAG: tRNA (adenosine(37)-N6)-threonylcarbamoyltransferase complex ATPase subunit type 1 TsaE [Pseudobacteriovorax sp.]|nr:tRNA (adenosine(37)-N6)-threonylcarbamoyltransferase complex ATPase subunit type 1 TsaE [Pseudobacteriovorax sp.]
MISGVYKESQLPEFFDKIAPLLERPYIVWLNAEMGAGKTTFVREFLRYKGLSNQTPVVSPTYTILNEYLIEGSWYAHLDLYRAEENFSLEEVGVQDRSYEGVFVEWPEAAPRHEVLNPTHSLSIQYNETLDDRSYSFDQL